MFYLINKPIWFTSFDVIRKIRKITGIKKMWHTGTLDPLASGCLLIATENSTKLISRLENKTKTYIFTVDISKTSPSLDLEENVTDVDISNMRDYCDNDIIQFLENQTQQLPPKYSAIHIDGKRAYKLVRKGVEFDIEQRKIDVSQVEIIEKNLPKITIRLTLSSWGYVRSFAPLLADFFWVTNGGCITYLHREKIGDLDVNDATAIENIKESSPIPYSKVLSNIEIYHLAAEYKKPLIDGLIVDIGNTEERQSEKEILIYCDEICSLGIWTNEWIKVIKNYV